MRIKVGDKWFKCEPGQPIMVQLTDTDRQNIASMVPEASRYALFDDQDELSPDEKLAWMDQGA